MLAYIDENQIKYKSLKAILTIQEVGAKLCKGPATINQINDTERILYPLKRKGERGGGKWENTWDRSLR